MTTSDTATPPRDVPFVRVGMGMGVTFLCAACVKKKPTLGRRLRRVMGLRQFVCKGCAG